MLPGVAHGTVYYIDFTNGNDNNTGLGTTSTQAFQSLDKFTENARSAGDIAFVRRGMASTTNNSQLDFTSDGTSANPIIIEADYDNLWNDFATTSQTYTFAVGSTTATASANQSDIVVGNWLYVMGDCVETATTSASFGYNDCQYAYEVSAVASTSITFHLPYKGNNAGSGKEVRKMPSAPQWNTAAGNSQVNIASDEYWILKGLELRGTNVNGIVFFSTGTANGKWFLQDLILTGNGANDTAILTASMMTEFIADKIRNVNTNSGSYSPTDGSACGVLIKNSKLVSLIGAASNGQYNCYTVEETSITGGISLGSSLTAKVTTRNVLNTTFSTLTTNQLKFIYNEDYNGIVGENTQFSDLANSNTQWVASSTDSSTYLRSGGGPVSIQIVGGSNMGKNSPSGYLKLFEYPIYANTSSKQYTVYFMSTSTSGWTADPTVKELWIECEYWDYPVNGTAHRTLKKSTDLLDFNGSTIWQSLSVTCQPSRTGVLYLRGWYAKTKEANKMNEFYIDGTPQIQ